MLIQNSLTRDWSIKWQSSVAASYFMTFLKMLMTSKWNGQKWLFLSSVFEGWFMVCVVPCSDRMLWQCWLRWLMLTCWRETPNVTSVLRLLRMHRLSWNHTKKYRSRTTGNSKFSLVRLFIFIACLVGFFPESSNFAITVKLIKLKGILCHRSEQNYDFLLAVTNLIQFFLDGFASLSVAKDYRT